MRVYVVMGNDFPDAVFTSAELAQVYCASKAVDTRPGGITRVYWRFYDFELLEALPTAVPKP